MLPVHIHFLKKAFDIYFLRFMAPPTQADTMQMVTDKQQLDLLVNITWQVHQIFILEGVNTDHMTIRMMNRITWQVRQLSDTVRDWQTTSLTVRSQVFLEVCYGSIFNTSLNKTECLLDAITSNNGLRITYFHTRNLKLSILTRLFFNALTFKCIVV